MVRATASGSASAPDRAMVRMRAAAREARRTTSTACSPWCSSATATAAARTRASSSVSHTRSWMPSRATSHSADRDPQEGAPWALAVEETARAARRRAASWAAVTQAASQGRTTASLRPMSPAARITPSRSGSRTTTAPVRASCSTSPGARVQAMTPIRRGCSAGRERPGGYWEGWVRTEWARRPALRAARRSKETTRALPAPSPAPQGRGGSSGAWTRAVGWRWWTQIWRARPARGRAARGTSVWTWTWNRPTPRASGVPTTPTESPTSSRWRRREAAWALVASRRYMTSNSPVETPSTSDPEAWWRPPAARSLSIWQATSE